MNDSDDRRVREDTERSRHALIRDCFHEAFDLDDDARARLLDERLGDDDALRSAVLDLLDTAKAVQDDSLLDTGISGQFDQALVPSIEGYDVQGVIGTGGMGTVYRAERFEPRQDVAIKVLTIGIGSAQLKARFRQESEALALLDHPGVTKVLQIGFGSIAEARVPYIAMELVDGVPITEYVNAANLRTPKILELFLQICDAVEHAHQRGVIHRDLKPANILVSEGGRARVLDFGIARLTIPGSASITAQTEVGQILGTAAYMSPEQATGDPKLVDTRTDVYALGVILFELLAGVLPHDISGLPPVEAFRVISTSPHRRLSETDTHLRGDLEVIVETALSPDIDRRYSSASLMAADIRNFLSNQPISARAPSAVYQISKFARRHQAIVGAGVAVVLALSAGLALTSWALSKEARARAEAEASLARADSSVTFMRNVLGGVDVRKAEGRDTELLLEMVGDAAATIPSIEYPSVRAEMRAVLGNVYYNVFEHRLALEALEAAAADFVAAGLADSVDSLDADLVRASTLEKLDQLEQAGEVRERVLSRLQEHHPDLELNGVVARDLSDQYMLEGRFEDALTFAERAVAFFGEHGPVYEEARAHQHLGASLRRMGDLDGAEAAYTTALKLFGHPDTNVVESVVALNSLAIVARQRGDLELAERRYEEAIALRDELDPLPSPQLASMLANYGRMLSSADRPNEALPIIERSIQLHRDLYEPGDFRIGYPMMNQANVLRQLGELDASAARYEEVIELWEGAFGLSHPLLVSAWADYGYLLATMERHDDAVVACRNAIRIGIERELDPTMFYRVARINLANSLVAIGRETEAIEQLDIVLAAADLSDQHKERAEAAYRSIRE